MAQFLPHVRDVFRRIREYKKDLERDVKVGASYNEAPVPLEADGLAPHLRVVRPSRPSLTYDRVE